MGRFRDTLAGRHVMVDGETLSLGGSCAFTQLAAIEFWPDQPDRECRLWSTYIDLADSMRLGRQLDASTILWWMDDLQGAGPEARQALVNGLRDHSGKSPPVDWRTALEQLAHFISGPVGRGLGSKPEPLAGVWSHGAGFDMSRLETAYRDLRMKAPFSHRDVLDTRTVFRLAGKRMEDLIRHEEAGLLLHDAAGDVAAQTYAIHQALKIIYGEEVEA